MEKNKNEIWFVNISEYHHQTIELVSFYLTDIPCCLKNSLNLKKIQSGKNWLWGIISHGCLAW